MIFDWWQSLNWELQVYYGVAIIATAVLFFQLIALLLGFAGDDISDLDATDAVDAADFDAGGVQFLSVRTVVAFAVGFGWTGVIAVKSGWGTIPSLAAALFVGGIFMLSIFAVMRFFYSLRSTGTIDYRNAIGQVGTVYLPIAPSRQGPGKVEVLVQGRLSVIDAYSNAERRIERQAKVKVVELIDRKTLLVDPL